MKTHSTDEFRQIASRGTILRCVVGSTVHGLSVSNQDDRDEMGICIEPPEYVIGLRRFEQYEHHTAWERPGGRANRSGPGDLDVTVYSLRKWMRLALAGNPTVLLPLFVPSEHLITRTREGCQLQQLRDVILSQQAGHRFLGYLQAQRRRLLEGRPNGRNFRPELVERYGFDVKFAGHMVRLGLQGAQLLEEGEITLPVSEPWRTWIVELRTGKHTKAEAFEVTEALECKINRLLEGGSCLPEHPRYDRAERWLIGAYGSVWATLREYAPC